MPSSSSDPDELAPVQDGVVSETVIPLLEERLVVGKRTVTSGRARVHISVSEHDEAVETMLMRQDVGIERVAIGTFVSEPPPVRREGDTIVVPVLEERVVVEKRLYLTEELHIRIDEQTRLSAQTVRLRREHAEIEHSNARQPEGLIP